MPSTSLIDESWKGEHLASKRNLGARGLAAGAPAVSSDSVIESVRQFELETPASMVWARFTRVSEFPTMWKALHDFDGHALVVGAVWHCCVQPPMPYQLRFTIVVEEVVVNRLIVATLMGDVSGHASLTLTDDGPRSTVVLRSRLRAEHRLLRALTRRVPSLATFGHDWVLDKGAQQFADALRHDR